MTIVAEVVVEVDFELVKSDLDRLEKRVLEAKVRIDPNTALEIEMHEQGRVKFVQIMHRDARHLNIFNAHELK